MNDEKTASQRRRRRWLLFAIMFKKKNHFLYRFVGLLCIYATKVFILYIIRSFTLILHQRLTVYILLLYYLIAHTFILTIINCHKHTHTHIDQNGQRPSSSYIAESIMITISQIIASFECARNLTASENLFIILFHLNAYHFKNFIQYITHSEVTNNTSQNQNLMCNHFICFWIFIRSLIADFWILYFFFFYRYY